MAAWNEASEHELTKKEAGVVLDEPEDPQKGLEERERGPGKGSSWEKSSGRAKSSLRLLTKDSRLP